MQPERDTNSLQALCSGGCGFYGSPATDGLCSLCYKKKPQQSPAVSAPQKPVPSSPTNSASKTSAQPTIPQSESPNPKKLKLAKDDQESTTAEASTSGEHQEDSSDRKETDNSGKKKKNRCASCHRKVGLTGFECRCGGLFCSAHRYSDKHDCQFDYRGMAAEEIRSKNPVVVGEKVQKI